MGSSHLVDKNQIFLQFNGSGTLAVLTLQPPPELARSGTAGPRSPGTGHQQTLSPAVGWGRHTLVSHFSTPLLPPWNRPGGAFSKSSSYSSISSTFKGEGKKLLFQPTACWAPWPKGMERSLLGIGSGVLGFNSSLPFFSIDPVLDYLLPAQISGLHRGRSACQTWGLLRLDLTSTPPPSKVPLGPRMGPTHQGAWRWGQQQGQEQEKLHLGLQERGPGVSVAPCCGVLLGCCRGTRGDFVGHS